MKPASHRARSINAGNELAVLQTPETRSSLGLNIFLQISGRRQPWYPTLGALLDGRLTLAVSTAILLKHEEITS
jgi:hypothetical protein